MRFYPLSYSTSPTIPALLSRIHAPSSAGRLHFQQGQENLHGFDDRLMCLSSHGQGAASSYRLQEAVIVHPVIPFLVAEDGDAAGGQEGQLEDVPLLVADIALL